ncbi:MAG: GNAT family N-acetyltransferase [Pseudomonadota bacterium]
MSQNIEIVGAQVAPELDAVRGLCRASRDWSYERYARDRAIVDAYYGAEAFEPLLVNLPLLHAAPAGAIRLAKIGGRPVGCIMFQRFRKDVCEMNRLFVAPEGRGYGVGHALCEAAMVAARRAGYRSMLLVTGPLHFEAQQLYAKLGFSRRDPYHEMVPLVLERAVFMERVLTGPSVMGARRPDDERPPRAA